MTVDEDSALVHGCLKGSVDQFQGLVEKYQYRIYLLVYGIVLDRELAKDLTQEVFIKAYQSLKSFKGKSSFYTWLYKIGFNLALDAKRKRSRRPQIELDESREATLVGAQSHVQPDREALRGELYTMILRGMEELTLTQRTVVLLREWEGYSYQEIAGLMKCSVGTVMSRLHYAREKLREYLKPYLKGNL